MAQRFAHECPESVVLVLVDHDRVGQGDEFTSTLGVEVRQVLAGSVRNGIRASRMTSAAAIMFDGMSGARRA